VINNLVAKLIGDYLTKQKKQFLNCTTFVTAATVWAEVGVFIDKQYSMFWLALHINIASCHAVLSLPTKNSGIAIVAKREALRRRSVKP
jgi:hypothetical protein